MILKVGCAQVVGPLRDTALARSWQSSQEIAKCTAAVTQSLSRAIDAKIV